MKKISLSIALIVTLFNGCGSSGGSSGSSGLYFSSGEWSSSSKYTHCSSSAKGDIGAVVDDSKKLKRFIYNGDETHHDCSVSDASNSIDVSYYDITEPISKEELKELTYITYQDEDRVMFDIDILDFDNSFIKLQVVEKDGGSVEIIELTRNSSKESVYKGSYSGSFSGDGSGSWSFSIDKSGKITGYANSYSLGRVALHGQLSNSNMTVGGASKDGVSVSFSGTINQQTGDVSGNWNTSNGYSGTFSGDRK